MKKTKQQQTVEPAGAGKIINPSDLLVIYCNSVYTEPVFLFQSVVGVITPHHPAHHPLNPYIVVKTINAFFKAG